MSEEKNKPALPDGKHWMDLEQWKAEDKFLKARDEMLRVFTATGKMPTPEMEKEIYAKYD